jgi:hypothetical protein
MEFVSLKNTMTNHKFPWFISKGVVDYMDDYYQFVHFFYLDNSINSKKN